MIFFFLLVLFSSIYFSVLTPSAFLGVSLPFQTPQQDPGQAWLGVSFGLWF